MKQESTFFNSDKRYMKTRAKSIAIARQEYSTSISEEYEYSYEKAERVSLPIKNARVQSS